LNKVRLFTLLITALMIAMLVAKCLHPIGMSDGGFA
jgi:hypothetical protein